MISAPAPTMKIVPAINAIYVGDNPVTTVSITGASSISSSFGFLLSGVESISGESLGLSSSLISATFVFKFKLSSPFIHVNTTSIVADSPGCNNVSFNWSFWYII